MSNGLELDELEIDASLFESNTEESYFKMCSRYKSEFKVKESEYFGEINKILKKVMISLVKILTTKLLNVRFVSLFELLMNVKLHAY